MNRVTLAKRIRLTLAGASTGRRVIPTDAALIACMLTLSFTAGASIITVDVTAGPGLPYLSDSAGDAVASGNEVQLGYFDTGFDVGALSGNLSALRNAWNPFGSLEVTEILTQSGRFSGPLSGDDAGFAGEQIYMLAFLTASSTGPDATWSNVQEYGIFTNGTSSAWTFPDGSSVAAPSTLVSSDTVTMAHWGSIGASSLQLASAVPEISTVWTSGIVMGAASIFFRRRRGPSRPADSQSERPPTELSS